MAITKPSWEESIRPTKTNEGVFSADFPSAFCFGDRGHGGFLITLVSRAARLHLANSPKSNFPDVLDLKAHFVRMVAVGPIEIQFEDILLNRQAATLQAKVSQRGKLNVIFLMSMGDLSKIKGPSFPVNHAPLPAPPPSDLSRLATDSDPNWISYQCPWDPALYGRVMSHVKMFLPRRSMSPNICDHWVTNTEADPSFAWTNEHLPYLADIIFSTSDAHQGLLGLGSHERMMAYCEQQARDRAAGRPLSLGCADPKEAMSPVVSYTTSFNIEVKKSLPSSGSKWLFIRNSTYQIKDGRMDWSVTIFDEEMEIVAVVHQLHNLIQAAANPQNSKKERKVKI